MPPHGHGGHGGGGHHHGGGRPGGSNVYVTGWGAGWGPSWDPGANYSLVTVEDDPDKLARAMAYVMSLPKNQRLAAYRKLFGKEPPPGALGDYLEVGGVVDFIGDHPIITAALGYLAYLWWTAQKERRRFSRKVYGAGSWGGSNRKYYGDRSVNRYLADAEDWYERRKKKKNPARRPRRRRRSRR